ncbi:DUF3219 family protein [Terribacillus sp. DMT04]|uniref:DUF3219 family protein n=1 Tax=Terribacillus sp. DMT04 TaxID=2850441 RepID=UPI0020B8BF61|nr:DUF3219 family protein [Terribacillus sp. DMT04]
MNRKVIVNGMELDTFDYTREVASKDGNVQQEIRFKFHVTSEAYHDVAVLLYKNDFHVEIPEDGIEFEAIIKQYSTSITNLYEADQVGEYVLVLQEKAIAGR